VSHGAGADPHHVNESYGHDHHGCVLGCYDAREHIRLHDHVHGRDYDHVHDRGDARDHGYDDL